MSTSKSVLITGAAGFLGRHIAQVFKQQGYVVYGLGYGQFSADEARHYGIDVWQSASISMANLQSFNQVWDVIVHCAGGSSVAKSCIDPVKDFSDTVSSTLQLLEFIRLHNRSVKLVYPSSAAVYGEHNATPIMATDKLQPVSPYGLHKMLAEEMCLAYHRMHQINVSIIRFFSIYGPGLKKQLLWDACNKLQANVGSVEFWGTGTETRDWIYISDAVQLIYQCVTAKTPSLVINGGSGIAYSISETLEKLAQHFAISPEAVLFNGAVKQGDPRHYHADMKEARAIGWQPQVSLSAGLLDYVFWFKSLPND